MTTDPTHEEIEAFLGAYALDAVSPDEARLVEAHLEQCERCTDEVARHRDVAANLAHSYEEPPDGLWSRIAAEIESPPVLPGDEIPRLAQRRGNGADDRRADDTGPARRSERSADGGRRLPRVLAAAAAVLLVVVLGGVIVRQDARIDELEQAMAPTVRDLADAALDSPDARTFNLVGGDGTRVKLVVEPSGRGYVFGGALPALAADRTYQLWGIDDEAVVSLGILNAEVAMFRMPASVGTLAITEEAAGGVVASTQDPIVAGEVVN